ncbi:hypothetical protein ACTA6D_003903 [Escherichia coli]
MAFRTDKKFLFHMMQRNRRRRDATLNPVSGVLGWVTPPQSTGVVDTGYAMTWQNGQIPYVVQVFKDKKLVSQNQSDLQTFTINKSSAARYDIKIISADGQILNGTIDIA